MRSVRRLTRPSKAWALGALLLGVGGCGGAEMPGDSAYSCNGVTGAGLQRIELGRLPPDPAVADEFTPLRDGDAIPSQLGSQGLTMIVLALRFTGAAYECVDEEIETTREDGRRLSAHPGSVGVQRDSAGRAVSPPIYLPGRFPRRFVVRATAGTRSAVGRYESGDYGDCSYVAQCESDCRLLPGCHDEDCRDVSPSRRAAMAMVRECLQYRCGMAPGMPCTDAPASAECADCTGHALRSQDQCDVAVECGQCLAALTACDAIAP